MRYFIVAEPSFIGAQLVGIGSRLNENDLNGSTPGNHLIEINEDGSPINQKDRARLLKALAGASSVAIAPIAPHAPNPTAPQAIPGQRPGSVQLAGGDLNFRPAVGVETDEAAAARIAQLEAEIETLRQARAAAGSGVSTLLTPEPPVRRPETGSEGEQGGPAKVEPGPLDLSIPDLETHLAGVSDTEVLTQLRTAEVAGKSRVGALAAIDARFAALSG